MTKFAVSPEGAESLRKLSQDVRNIMEHMSTSGRNLQNAVMTLDEGLGAFSDKAIVLASDCVAAVATASSSSERIASLLESKASVIEALIGSASLPGSNASTADSYGSLIRGMRPVAGATPRSLESTEQQWTINNGESIYDHPEEMSHFLYASQGSAYSANFGGTCGLCSCANVLRLAGVELGEKEMIDFAAPNKLCDYVMNEPDASGGTGPLDRQVILAHFGIDSSIVGVDKYGGSATYETMDKIADAVSAGKGVIASVHANTLYASGPAEDDFHAVTITSVRKDRFGNIAGFYIADSNIGTTYYPASLVSRALTGSPLNITTHSIR